VGESRKEGGALAVVDIPVALPEGVAGAGKGDDNILIIRMGGSGVVYLDDGSLCEEGPEVETGPFVVAVKDHDLCVLHVGEREEWGIGGGFDGHTEHIEGHSH
jgi:hypothetical protein